MAYTELVEYFHRYRQNKITRAALKAAIALWQVTEGAKYTKS